MTSRSRRSADAGGTVPIPYRGLEQFDLVAATPGLGYCVSGERRYALDLANDQDVICLLLGGIVGEAKFDDDASVALTFQAESSAFHPKGGNVRVKAGAVKHGFLAFSYSEEFERQADDGNLGRARLSGSRNNIQPEGIRSLARYARQRVLSNESFSQLEVQCLATLVYLETIRHLDGMREPRKAVLSDREFQLVCDYIRQELDGNITCAKIAAAVGLPLRVIFDGIKTRTGYTPYRFVIEKRIEAALHLLTHSNLAISEIAFACGFSSQQHMTAVLSGKLGKTPQRIRKAQGGLAD
jgi:AraC family transcriptional regulator